MTARLLCAAVLLAALPAPAAVAGGHTADPTKEPPPVVGLTVPRSYSEPPEGMRLSAAEALRLAARNARVRAELRHHRDTFARAYVLSERRWRVSWYVPDASALLDRDEVVQTAVDDRSGRILSVWTGFQIEWPMARGHPGAFGRAVNAPYVWIPLCLLFLAPFARPPWRIFHLDLLVLLAFSAGYAYFNDAQVGVSTTSAQLLLAYLLARLLWVAWRRPDRPPDSWIPTDVLTLGLVFLVGFRIALNIINGNVIDVGFSGVIGADRITDGNAIYGDYPASNPHFDTYGPVNYLAYVPFELIFPWSGTWDGLPAAHAAAIAFDLAVIAALYVLGRRLGGRRTGVLLAYLWAAFPFSVLALNSSSNDALVGALMLAALVAYGRPLTRGAFAALAGATKFAPFAVAPLLWGPGRTRFAIGFGAALLLFSLPAFLGGGSEAFLDRTFGFQQGRAAPFSVWGYYEGLETVQLVFQLAVVGFALSLAVVRHPGDTVAVAALCAAVLVAVQMALAYWFYLYLVWFVPLMLVALLAPRERAPAAARSSPPVVAASTG